LEVSETPSVSTRTNVRLSKSEIARFNPSVSLTCHDLAVEAACAVESLRLPGTPERERAVFQLVERNEIALLPETPRMLPETLPPARAGMLLPGESRTLAANERPTKAAEVEPLELKSPDPIPKADAKLATATPAVARVVDRFAIA